MQARYLQAPKRPAEVKETIENVKKEIKSGGSFSTTKRRGVAKRPSEVIAQMTRTMDSKDKKNELTVGTPDRVKAKEEIKEATKVPEFHKKAPSPSKDHEVDLAAEIAGDARKLKQAGKVEGGKDKCSDEVSTRSSK